MCDIYAEQIVSGLLVADEKMSNTATFGHGLISLIGRQRSMEDSFTVFPNLVQLTGDDKQAADKEETAYDFFAVFDGHGGHKVSHKCRERLHYLVAEEVAARGGWRDVDWDSVMSTSFSRMDVEVAEAGVVAACGKNRSITRTVGSTALVVVIGKEVIVVANCGDCRAVLFRDGAPFPLSRDHKPERPDEKQRVEAAGGDYNLKPYMTSEPEVQICKRGPTDEFMVIATDGLWDVLANETACDLVRKCFYGQFSKKVLQEVHGNCSAAAATMLAELAIARGSNDNISVIVVQLQSFEAST
ncbi:protein phosphatase 2C 51-like [Silene latifolia]|uniref:protein phosphatase 2C 51-like n=1 Tax=Silene latifolia TaxID=37657 RepID=UPI003D77669C